MDAAPSDSTGCWPRMGGRPARRPRSTWGSLPLRSRAASDGRWRSPCCCCSRRWRRRLVTGVSGSRGNRREAPPSPSAKAGGDDAPPAAEPDDAQPSATPVAHLLQRPESRAVLRPYHGEQPAEPGGAKVPRHPGDAGSCQIEPAKGRHSERVELVDVARAEREGAAEIVDPRVPRGRPARMHDLPLVPDREALMALGETQARRGCLGIGTKPLIRLEVAEGEE